MKICKELKRVLKYSIMYFALDIDDMKSLKRPFYFYI